MAEEKKSNRYQRQMLLSEIGSEGQALLSAAKVLVIGAGGLGCPALQYLVAAGVGTIGISDGDSVDESNLHRQPLYNSNDIGQLKVSIAKQKLTEQNPDCQIIAHPYFLQPHNAWETIAGYDFILDGSDNFSTRYLVNDICVLQNKPLIYGAVYKFEGQVAVFNIKNEKGEYSANYRDIYPIPPQAGSIPNCSTAGVLGVLPGIIGTMQATELIKLIVGIGTPLTNKLLNYNTLTNHSLIIEINATEEGRNAVPKNRNAIESLDYNVSCDMPGNNNALEITAAIFECLRATKKITIVDVRENHETPFITQFEHLKIPMSVLNNGNKFQLHGDVIFICQTGIRSQQAAQWALNQNEIDKAYSLQGGIINWLKLISQ